jgi:hypothetical protein
MRRAYTKLPTGTKAGYIGRLLCSRIGPCNALDAIPSCMGALNHAGRRLWCVPHSCRDVTLASPPDLHWDGPQGRALRPMH